MRTITILGGSGFLGSQLSFFLSKNNNNRVIIFDKKRQIKLKKSKIHQRKYFEYKTII